MPFESNLFSSAHILYHYSIPVTIINKLREIVDKQGQRYVVAVRFCIRISAVVRLKLSAAMKRVIEEALNEPQPVKKQKVVVSKISNSSDGKVNGSWIKVEKKKKKKQSKAGVGKQNVRCYSQATGFITIVHLS